MRGHSMPESTGQAENSGVAVGEIEVETMNVIQGLGRPESELG